MAGSQFQGAADAWEEILFAVNGSKNASVCVFHRETFTSIRLQWHQCYGYG